jgi:hypothetical protein
MEWLRKNDLQAEELDEPTIRSLANLAGIPLPAGKLGPKRKEESLDDAMDWMRKNNPHMGDLDDPALMSLANVAGVPIP